MQVGICAYERFPGRTHHKLCVWINDIKYNYKWLKVASLPASHLHLVFCEVGFLDAKIHKMKVFYHLYLKNIWNYPKLTA